MVGRKQRLREHARRCMSSIMRWRPGVMTVSFRRRGTSLRQSEYRQMHGTMRKSRSTREGYTIHRRRIEFNKPMKLTVAFVARRLSAMR